MQNKFNELIQLFNKQHVLIIGDAMLDTYLAGKSTRICREAPVPIVDVTEEHNIPGGGANTAVNIASLGASVKFLSVIGNDLEGQVLSEKLASLGVSPASLFQDTSRKTLTKKRISADSHLLVRFDRGSTKEISEELEEKIITQLIENYEKADAVIISDYGYGTLTDRITQTIHSLQKKMPRVLVIDSKYLDHYRHLSPTAVKPNFKEAVNLLGITKEASNEKRVPQIRSFRSSLLEKTGSAIVAVTIDKDGALLFDEKNEYQTYATPVKNIKAAGAGDTYISALTLSLASGANLSEVAEISSAATAIITKKEETSHCTQHELSGYFSATSKYISDKKTLQQTIEYYKAQGKRIVFTNGCFDILHSGHVSYLNKAKARGDVLIVALNTDQSIKRLKGSNRPINVLSDRLHVLSGLSSIDHLVSFPEDTPIRLIEDISPDIFVKGGDYREDTLPETPIVKKLGGKIEIIPLVPNRSTSHVIKQILNHRQDSPSKKTYGEGIRL